MRIISLVPVGRVEEEHLHHLAESLASRWDAACLIQPVWQNGASAYHAGRGQYHSTEILRQLVENPYRESWRILGVTEVDLYIPILTFVFGEAHLSQGAALVSSHRLRPEFHGLPPQPSLLQERLVKEAIHELGHTFGLRHCPDYLCVMSASHAVERIDLKQPDFCSACAAAARRAGL
jgi:archaemetzincin